MTKPHDFKTLFTDETLVGYANHLLDAAGSQYSARTVKDHGDNWVRFKATGPRGGEIEIVAPLAQPRPGVMFFRSLLKVPDPSRGGTWLTNGQASTGTSEIAHFGESGPWLATSLTRLRAYLDANRVNVAPDRHAEFDSWVNGRLAEATDEGLVSDEEGIIVREDGNRRIPLFQAPASAARI